MQQENTTELTETILEQYKRFQNVDRCQLQNVLLATDKTIFKIK